MSKAAAELDTRSRVSTGIAELDEILEGGLSPHQVYLIEGNPGSGKTTLALQFLRAGRELGEKTLYVTLSESRQELLAVARSHGWSLDGVEIFELGDPQESLEPESQYTMFQPSEVELNVTTNLVLKEVERIKPTRLVFDSLSEMRLLAQNALRYRRQILALKHFFSGRNCTVLLLDDKTSDVQDLQLQSITHGVIHLDQLSPEYGAERRRLQVTKMRGVRFRGGYHDFVIERGGLSVFPRLVAADEPATTDSQQLSSGNREIDSLLGGGLERGTSVLLMGPAGSGKSTFAMAYAIEAAKRGQRAAIFIFDESIETLVHRCAGLSMDLKPHLESGLIRLQQVDPAELSPGEFAHTVRMSVDKRGGREAAEVVIIDSLNGYLNAMPEERFLVIQLHELLSYLGRLGVVTFLVVAQHGMLGSAMPSPVDTSYLADAVVLFRYFELRGEVRQAISVVKKRRGAHERTIRELSMSSRGIHVGPALRDFRGVLTGVPLHQSEQADAVEPSDERT